MCQSDDISYNEQNEYAWKQSADKNDLNSFVGLCGGTTPPPTGGTPPFPGTNLSVGSSGSNVRLIQQAINTIAPCHPGRLWVLNVDGNFGNMTRDAVFSFQSVFGMPVTGVVNQATWNRLMQEAANVSANCCAGGGTTPPPPPGIPPFPGTNLSVGSSGNNV
ncbi:MAG: peptidoglycan-binding protein, partial [Oscillospiraceae bacterium]|nr:peptidoglycan-binding protein [Oscillospiraceae bacterium]